MDESQINALLDAHDGLIAAYLDGTLALIDFVAAYGEFPRSYALDEPAASGSGRAAAALFRPRIAFHSRVAGVLASLRLDPALDSGIPGDFMPMVVMQRLRMLVAQYPNFKIGGQEPPLT